MTYATSQNLIERYGVYELEQVAPGELAGLVDEIRVIAALDDAHAEVNSYLGQRYGLPIQNVPAVLTAAVCDMARYYLYAHQATDEVKGRYNQRISWLKDIANNKASLGADEAGAGSSLKVAVVAGRGSRLFTRDTLTGF
ncbi:DUF1320 domain-containing protein [Salinimonas marina]|uniref:DUF1320 domain-containing protein n=1 Tax=Salinimonas marina TaxID=2785918 RepID=A0A7S9DZ79_9ALTE|nr:phage protein Gp36 family protein [Salinimonas marina]QPG06557.1 DUF1320 domain-containing protein [Salinimonas marina]